MPDYPNTRTRIVCTIGPSSWDQEVMKKMIESGMDVARVNGAFADREELLKVESLVRAVSQDVSLMIDIKGPEVRMNKFPEPIKLEVGQILEVGSSDKYAIYPYNYPETYKKMTVGQKVVIGDGDVAFEVSEVKSDSFLMKVLYGEVLKPGKALNFPGIRIGDSLLTEKDIDLLEYAKERKWEFVSASFISSKQDALTVKEQLKGSDLELIAKIEDGDGVEHIDEILEIVDGVMVARGGLGVEMGLEKVPLAQRKIIKAATKAARPVITATQMLDSMERNLIPTRAEANDVATAILLGTDAIMLSGESTAGKYPVEAVQFMSKVDASVGGEIEQKLAPENAEFLDRIDLAFSQAIFQTCQTLQDLGGVIYVTESLHRLTIFTRYNIKQPIYTFMNNESKRRQALLRKGVTRSLALNGGDKTTTELFKDRDEAMNKVREKVDSLKLFKPGERYLMVVDLFEEPADFPKIFEIVTAR